jgi:hypothetical protein
MTPTRQQLEAARHLVDIVRDAARSGHALKLSTLEQEAFDVLLAATAPPSEEELAEEAARLWPDDNSRQAKRVAARESRRAAYIAGARREGWK